MSHHKSLAAAFLAVVIFGTPWIVEKYPGVARSVDSVFSYIGNNYAATFLRESITIKELHSTYKSAARGRDKVRILIVPGHEPSFGGTEYGDVKERDIVVGLAQDIAEFFAADPHYEIVISRDNAGWNPELQTYFDQNWQSIASFVQSNKEEMLRLVNNGNILKMRDSVIPNDAPINTALRLYGINKWANENDIDIALHVHFNDYPRRNAGVPGKHSGFSIYVPEKQYSNSTTTRAIASSVFNRLAKYNAVSDFEGEEGGVIEHQELIATGAYNTLDAPSLLIEYSYIYEPQIVDPVAREAVMKDLAFQTYLGVQDFFGKTEKALVYDTLMLPRSWNDSLSRNSKNKSDEVLALQTVLILEGLYPPQNRSKNDCPRTGMFGPCTASALDAFQLRYGIIGEPGIVGEETKKVLNSRYSSELR